MNYSTVTDINNNKIYNNSSEHFLLLHIKYPSYFLKKLEYSFWELNAKNITHILHKNNIISNKYFALGHLWSLKNSFKTPFIILLAHESVSKYPVDFVKIRSYGNGFIWKPYAPGCKELGLLYSSHKPDTQSVRVLLKQYTAIHNTQYNTNNLNTKMNRFNYLGQTNLHKHTLSRKYINSLKKSDVESYDTSNSTKSTDSWTFPRGNTVILVEPDEPWYINKKNTSDTSHFIPNEKQLLDNTTIPKAKFNTDSDLDYNKPNLGHGYSYKSRNKIQKCKCTNKKQHNSSNKDTIETFNETHKKNTILSQTINIILLCLLAIIISLILCKAYVEYTQ